MKNIKWLLLLLVGWGCDDGDLDVKRIDFDSVILSTCTPEVSTTIFFKVKEDESLILALPEGLLQNMAGETIIAIPAQAQFYYRFFKGNVTSDYFCSVLPPATPVVDKQLEAIGGTLLIETVEEDLGDGTFNYHHTFTIENLVLTNEDGEQIIDTNFELGVFTTHQ